MGKYPSGIITVVIRDDSPFVHMEEPVRHRTVQIRLTEDQLRKLVLHYTGTIGCVDQYETVSQVFMEPVEVLDG